MKDDTISRRAALKGLEDLNIASWYELNEHSNEAYHEIKQMLETLPTVDAAPIRHGEWVDVHFRTVPYDRITGAKKCPYCGKKKDKYVQWNWCPNCGAKMNGKDGDHNVYNMPSR